MTKAKAAILIATLSAANFAIGMGAFVVIGVLTPISEGLGMTSQEAGFVLTSYAIAYAVQIECHGGLSRRSEKELLRLAGSAIIDLARILSLGLSHQNHRIAWVSRSSVMAMTRRRIHTYR